MCGRYGFIPTSDFADLFEIEDLDAADLHASYNVAPGMIMPVLTMNSPKRVQKMKWGLIPFWAKDPSIAYKTINARSEDIEYKPSFRAPFKSNRCLIPTSGFYEWAVISPKEKQPYWFQLKNRPMFALAGVFDIWKDVEGKEFKTYSIVTTSANGLVDKVHPRMPVIIHKEDEDEWADNSHFDIVSLKKIMQPYPVEEMTGYHVSRAVNSAKNDGPDLIKPERNVPTGFKSDDIT